MPDDKHPPQIVIVTIDGREVQIAAGTYKVSQLKAILGVPADKELDEVRNKHLVPLNDEASVHVKGGEDFISHARVGHSS